MSTRSKRDKSKKVSYVDDDSDDDDKKKINKTSTSSKFASAIDDNVSNKSKNGNKKSIDDNLVTKLESITGKIV